MRTLTSTLTAAQKTPSARPAVLVAVRDRVGSAKRMVWSSLYDGNEADSYHAAVCPADNSLVRARTDGTSLYRQRTASPGGLSDFSAWTLFSGVTLITGKGIALAATADKAALVYTADDGLGTSTLYCVESADSGATWGAPVAVLAAGAATDFEHVAVAYASSDILVCFYTTGASSETLKRIIRTSGTWGAAASWTNTANAITGIAASRAPSADIHMLVTGKITATLTYHLWGCVYGLGVNQANDTWSALKEIRKAHYGAGATYLYPSIAWVDVYREAFVETYSGDQTYSRVMGIHTQSAASFITNLHHDDYRLPVLEGSYGYAIASNASHVFLSTPSEIYWNTDTVTATDVSADVLSVRQSSRPYAGELHVDLDNSDGGYNTPPFTIGNEVDFQPGYYGTSGAEYSSGQVFFIESLEHIAEAGKAQLVIHAVDAWGLLARMQARTAIEFNRTGSEKTYKDLVEFFLSLAGITLTVVSSSSPFTGEYPRISIHSGQSYAAFIKGLYERLNDVIYVRGAAARSFNPSSGDAADYSYGGSNHPIVGARYVTNALSANRFQVQGTAVYADSFVQTQTNQLYTRYRPFTDANANTAARATAIATALSNKELFHAYGGELTISGVNCGQELYDMIAVTDSRAGLSSAKRRVFAIELAYEPWKGRYQMTLGLAGAQ